MCGLTSYLSRGFKLTLLMTKIQVLTSGTPFRQWQRMRRHGADLLNPTFRLGPTSDVQQLILRPLKEKERFIVSHQFVLKHHCETIWVIHMLIPCSWLLNRLGLQWWMKVVMVGILTLLQFLKDILLNFIIKQNVCFPGFVAFVVF